MEHSYKNSFSITGLVFFYKWKQYCQWRKINNDILLYCIPKVQSKCTEKIKSWNRCFIYFLKNIFFFKSITFSFFWYCITIYDSKKSIFTDMQVMTQMCFLWRKKQTTKQNKWAEIFRHLNLFSLIIMLPSLEKFFNGQLQIFVITVYRI